MLNSALIGKIAWSSLEFWQYIFFRHLREMRSQDRKQSYRSCHQSSLHWCSSSRRLSRLSSTYHQSRCWLLSLLRGNCSDCFARNCHFHFFYTRHTLQSGIFQLQHLSSEILSSVFALCSPTSINQPHPLVNSFRYFLLLYPFCPSSRIKLDLWHFSHLHYSTQQRALWLANSLLEFFRVSKFHQFSQLICLCSRNQS